MSSTLYNDLTVQRVLRDTFGYQQFKAGQLAVINAALAGQDCLVVMPTGGGKSLCYQIPALIQSGLTVVISPLIALMKDQVDQLSAYGIAAGCLHSAQSWSEQQRVLEACHQGTLKLLYVAPERIMAAGFLQQLTRWSLTFLAIDEAHCISQWGHDFRPEYRALGQFRQQFPNIPLMALTATADASTRQDIVRLLGLCDPLLQINSFDRTNIRYTVVEKFKPLEQLWYFIRKQTGGSGIVYCNSRRKVTDIALRLRQRGLSVMEYHAGLPHEQRSRAQDAFQRDDIQIIVATVAFGMGINKPNVRFVIHFDIPRTIEAYYQETGRAGRDGLPAEALLLYDPADMAWLQRCLADKPIGQQKDIEQQKLNAIQAFAEAQTCRRLVLLNYFAEGRQQPCGHCDICENPPQQYDGLEDAQKALSCVYRVGQQFGLGYISDVLRGANITRIREHGHDTLSVYGLGKEHSNEYWVSILRQLIHLGFLQQNMMQHAALQLTPAARTILRGEIPLRLAIPRLDLLKKSGYAVSTNDNNHDPALLRKLRQLRRKLADENGVPPYVIFNDTSLLEMAHRQPRSAEQFLQINGVGQRKLHRFGTSFLHVLQQHILVQEDASPSFIKTPD